MHLLITEVNLVDVSSDNNEIVNHEYKAFHVNLNNVPDKCYNDFNERDKYFKFFLLDDVKELEELSRGDEIMNDAVDKLKCMSNDSYFISDLEKKQIEQYAREMALMDTFNDGKKQEKIEIAKKSLKENIDVNIISKITGLTIDEINELK